MRTLGTAMPITRPTTCVHGHWNSFELADLRFVWTSGYSLCAFGKSSGTRSLGVSHEKGPYHQDDVLV